MPPAAALFGEYGEAAVYSAMNNRKKPSSTWRKRFQQGYAQPEVLSTDPNLAALHTDPRFAQLVEQAKKNQRPCAYTTENRQLISGWANGA